MQKKRSKMNPVEKFQNPIKKIQCFDAFGEEDWIDTWTDSLITLVKNRKEISDKYKHETKVVRTYMDGFDMIYFMITDHMGHTEWFRMDELKFYEERSKLKDI